MNYIVRHLVLAALIIVAVAACSRDASEQTHSIEASAKEHRETLPLPLRLAFMTGHVEAGLALYRAGEPEMAAPHLLHPVSETHASEREGLDAYGFDATLFEAVSKALEEGRPASEIEPQLKAAEENLQLVAERVGGNTSEIINFLLDKIIEEYDIAITDGAVSDPGEYQDAYGFAVVARNKTTSENVHAELNNLIKLWPDAPTPPDNPTPAKTIKSQVEKVRQALEKSS